ncbi:flagellar motor protein MotB [Treponema sp.]|jgi:chemotaxis protein MotB|uniref:flagellar motor protein MotB n=1 Tax=Treponema sp. TaxID=166 RepID=UPI00257AADC6|nr:flagellar motor protein MotB [Treponema sp.]MBE6354165.1 flagellar motor protein MotB [Treponema sp.]
MSKKQKKEPAKPSTAWQGTYGDMITLMLCFFVMLYNPEESDAIQMAALQASISNNNTGGGISLSPGSLADMGNVVSALPSMEKGKALGVAYKKAVSSFTPQTKSNKVTITSDERGIVISLASDAFFRQGSAELDMEQARDTLRNISVFFRAEEVKGRRWRIEGHTDNTPVPSGGAYPSNWELSAARAANVLHYLTDFGVDEKMFSIAGYADTRPKVSNNTEEGRAYNRRVDVIVLDDGHF